MYNKVVINLSKLKVGQEGVVILIENSNKIIKRKLLEMGLVKNTLVKMVRKAPLGDPCIVEFLDYELCMRKKVLSLVIVEVILE